MILTKNKYFYCLHIIFISTSALADHLKPISYHDALNLALNNNPYIKSNNAVVESAQGAVLETRGMKWPKLHFEVNGARSDNPLNVFGYKLSQGNATFADFGAQQYTGPNTLYTKPNALDNPGYYSNIDTAFKLTLPIYSGGKLEAQQRNSEAVLNAAKQGNQQARNQIAYQLFESYEGVLTAHSMITIAHDQVRRAKAYLMLTQRLSKQSITRDSDILMASAYLNASVIALSDAKIQHQNQLDTFRTLLGSPDSTWMPKKPVTLSHAKTKTRYLINKVLHCNPELHAHEAKISAEKENVLVAQSAYKPHVNLELRHDWNGATIGEGFPSNILALGVQWTIFNGSERVGAVQKAKAHVQKAQFDFDDRRNQLMLTIRQLKRNEHQAQYTYQLNHQMVKQENTILHSLKERFGRGLLPLNALLESQLNLTQGKAHEIQALHTQKLLLAQLLMLTNQLASSAQ